MAIITLIVVIIEIMLLINNDCNSNSCNDSKKRLKTP